MDDNFSTNPVLPPRRRGKNRTILVVGLSLGGSVLIGVLALIIWVTGIGRKRYDEDDNASKNQGFNEFVDYEFELSGPRKYSYKELSQATNNCHLLLIDNFFSSRFRGGGKKKLL